jgi:hypothetical protein
VLREDLGKHFVDERSQFGAEFPANADALFESRSSDAW